MAQFLPYNKWGNGHDLATWTTGTFNTFAACTATAGGTRVTTALGPSVGDMVVLHQSVASGTTAGQWELVYVTATGTGYFDCGGLTGTYTTGAQAILMPQFTGGTMSSTVTAGAWNGTTGGWVAAMFNGPVTISGTITANGNIVSAPVVGTSGNPAGGVGCGFKGGAADAANNDGTAVSQQGGGYPTNTGAWSTAANGNGGGGGRYTHPYGCGNGGGGGNGTAGVTPSKYDGSSIQGTGGSAVGNSALTSIFFGGGGGGGCKEPTYSSAGGGSGAGCILLIAPAITVTGSITANGGAGGSANGPGGGGAGGSILFISQLPILGTSKVSATGGAGGTGQANGGAGGSGYIRANYLSSVSGTTNPTLSSGQDTNLTSFLYGGML